MEINIKHTYWIFKIEFGGEWQKNSNNSVLSKIKVIFSLPTQSGGRWSRDRWDGCPWYQASRPFISLLCRASIPKFIFHSWPLLLPFICIVPDRKREKRIRVLSLLLRTLPWTYTYNFLFICHWQALSVIAKIPSKGVWEMWNLFQMVTHPTENQGLCHIEEEEEKHYEATSSLYTASIFTDNLASAYSHNRLTSHMPIFQLYFGLFP